MGYSKLSVTIPDDIYQEIKVIASKKRLKLSHLVTEALVEKTRKMKEDSYIQRINEVFSDPEVDEEQHQIAELIAENTELEELPW